MTDRDREESPLIFSLGLALGLLAIVVLLNLLGDEEVIIKKEQFEKLLEEELIDRIEIYESGIKSYLKKRVRFYEDGTERYTQVTWYARSGTEASGEAAVWGKKSIEVTTGAEESSDGGGWLLLLVFLGIGGWYMWKQIQEDRNGIGSPRRRLNRLEQEFSDGKIDGEEYQKARENIWAEM